MIIDKDVDVPLRDGARLKADVFRPAGDGRVPVLINIGAYQKDKLWVPPPDLEEAPNPHMNWETVNPLWWVPRGYATVRVDTRGSGKSPGETDPWSLQEALDFYDSIEWAARQRWCNGAVATIGISYFAMTQWLVAGLQPPSLKCIVPWEGAADMYRDFAYHGGIFSFGFVVNWFMNHQAHHLLGAPYAHNPDAFRKNWLWEHMRHSLDSGWWASRQPRWDRITQPMYSAGNWSGMGLHLRGNTEGYVRAASRHKKLRIHAGTHYHAFYAEEARRDQLRFLDCWTRGIRNGIMDEPPVRLLIRRGGAGNYVWRDEREWPLARTQWTRLYLHCGQPDADGVAGRLGADAPAHETQASYPGSGATRAGVASASWTASAAAPAGALGASFLSDPLAEDTEVTGPASLQLWAGSSSEDLDVFVTLRNIGPDGRDVWETGQQGQDVPVAKGWLRASHRKLDAALTLPWRPYHAHDERRPLSPGEPVEMQVEIWPTCMVFARGHRIRLDITPRDGVGSSPYTHYNADYKNAVNTLFSGPGRPSFLLLPVIPRS